MAQLKTGRKLNVYIREHKNNMSLISSDFYDAKELAKLKGVHVKSVYRWVKANAAPPYEVFAGMYWFHKKEAEAWRQPRARRK